MVSVIMPVYNSGRYLQAAADSVLQQSLRDIELILVDDGSTDGSAETCDAIAASDPRVKVIHKPNGGICSARNAGLDAAQGKYVAFSDHDDEYGPNQLLDNYRLAEATGADVTKYGSHTVVSDGNSEISQRTRQFAAGYYSAADVEANFWELWHAQVLNGVWGGLFRRDFIERHGIRFDPYYKTGGEDFDFNWQCAGAGATYSLNDKTYYRHFVRAGVSTSSKYNPYTLKMILKRPDILRSRISKLHTREERRPDIYAFYIMRVIIADLCHQLALPTCDISPSDGAKLLASVKESSHYRPWLKDVTACQMVKISSMRYGLPWWLFKHSHYKWCIKMFKILTKYNEIKAR